MALQQSGPFESKLLRGVTRWAQRWLDRGRVTWRSLKMVTGWTAQILVYPLYVAFQTGRWLHLQLQQTTESRRVRCYSLRESDLDTRVIAAQEAHPPADFSLQRVLAVVRQGVLPHIPGWQSTPILSGGHVWVNQRPLLSAVDWATRLPTNSLSSGLTSINREPRVVTRTDALVGTIRGLASQIASRALVLVTDQNIVLDILQPGQQQFLQRVIAWEVAHFWRVQRLQATVSHLAWTPRLGVDAPWLLRVYLDVMAWMARTPVAIAANLFREAETWGALADSTYPRESPTLATPHVYAKPSLGSMSSLSWESPTVAAPYALQSHPSHQKQPQPLPATVPNPFPRATALLQTPPQTPLAPLNLASSTDYIDTAATLVGYWRSPLERFLRWLDRCLVWLERWLFRGRQRE